MITFFILLAAASNLAGSASWSLAFERGDDIWIARGDGKYARPLIKSGSEPKWSPDGKQLAFVNGRDVHVCTLDTRKVRKVYTFSSEEMPFAEPDASFGWDTHGPRLLMTASNSKSIHVANLPTGEEFDFQPDDRWPSMPLGARVGALTESG